MELLLLLFLLLLWLLLVLQIHKVLQLLIKELLAFRLALSMILLMEYLEKTGLVLYN